MLREQPGLEYVKLARRLHADGSEDVLLFEEWRDMSAVYAWVGPRLTEPRLVPGVKELIEELTVSHYEALDLDISPADAFGAPPGTKQDEAS